MTVAAALRNELLLFAAVGLLIGGADDMAIDLFYFFRRLWRGATVYRRHRRMTAARLPQPRIPGTMAVLIPAWDEADVIGPMLTHCLHVWAGQDVHFFVGIYPNDPATQQAVAAVASGTGKVTLVVTPDPGPTTKADCLNALWRAVLRYEVAAGAPVKSLVLHDAEDVVHPDAMRLLSVMVERFALVQLPVLPLPMAASRWIAGHYCDEFAEAHAKELMVREALGAALPSAGVGCAIARTTMAAIAHGRNGSPFDPHSLTEDYELGLRIGDAGGRGVIVRMADARGQLIATREYFPDSIAAAVRQKARWTVGIALAGWDRLGWGNGPVEAWMRLRDRRAILAALVLSAGYAGMVMAGVMMLAGAATVMVVPPLPGPVAGMLSINAALLFWRMAVRALFVGRAYGMTEALYAVPRIIVGNIIAIMAARRAMWIYFRLWRGAALNWDKTRHRFPGAAPGGPA